MPFLPGQSPPLLVLDSAHRGALVVIAGAIALTITLVGLIIRLYIHVAVNPHYGNDDFFLLLATVLGFCQSVVVFFSVSKGFGNSIDLISPKDLIVVRRIYYAGDILYLVILYVTKCCVLCILLKLTPRRAAHHRATWGAFILSTLWVIPSVLMVSINCGFSNPVGNGVHICTKVYLRWQLIVAFDVVTELFLFILATLLLRNLQMKMRRKLVVLSAFAARLPLICFSLLRLSNFDHDIHTLDPPLELVSTSVWTQIHMHYSIIACTVFSLRTFTAAVSTHYGTAGSQALDSGVNTRVDGVKNYNSSGSGGSSSKRRRGSIASSPWYMSGGIENGEAGAAAGGRGAGDKEKENDEEIIGLEKVLEEGRLGEDEEGMVKTTKGKEKEKGNGNGGNKSAGENERSIPQRKITRFSQQRFSMGNDVNIELSALSMLEKRKQQTGAQVSERMGEVAAPPIPGVADGFDGDGSDSLPQSTATATVTKSPSQSGSGGNGAKRHQRSGGSDDSTKLMIQRDMEYSVQYKSRHDLK